MTRFDCLSAARPPSSAEIILRKYQYDGVKYKDNKSNAIDYVAFAGNQAELVNESLSEESFDILTEAYDEYIKGITGEIDSWLTP